MEDRQRYIKVKSMDDGLPDFLGHVQKSGPNAFLCLHYGAKVCGCLSIFQRPVELPEVGRCDHRCHPLAQSPPARVVCHVDEVSD